jgi:hypothetical protein
MSSLQDTVLDALPTGLSDLVRAEMKFGKDLFALLGGNQLPNLVRQYQTMYTQRMRGCCDIPPPCWMPVCVGNVISLVADCGGTTSVRVHIRNRGMRAQRYNIAVQSADPSKQIPGATINVNPTVLELLPFQEGDMTVTLTTPTGTKEGTLDLNVFVRGCRDFHFRWCVRVGAILKSSEHELCIDDCPDFVHHWYDHFYCGRTCADGKRG